MPICGLCNRHFDIEDQMYCGVCTIQVDASFRGDEPATPLHVVHAEAEKSGDSNPECAICGDTSCPIADTACCENQLCLGCIRTMLVVGIGIGDVLCPYCRVASLMTTVMKINEETDASDDEGT